MSLEKQIEDLVVALNNNTIALLTRAAEPKNKTPKADVAKPAVAPAPAPAAETPKPEPKAETPAAPATPTVNEVRAAAQALLDVNENKDDGLFASLNAKYGVKRVSETPEANRAEVIAAINAKVEAVKAAKSAASEV